MTHSQNILVIRLTAIGDVVLTLPAVALLRQKIPGAKITFLTTRENADLLRGFRDVNETITLNRAIFRGGNPLRIGGELLRLIQKLRAGKFSLVVDLQSNGESGWLTQLTGAPQRWGFATRVTRRWAYTSFTDHFYQLHPAKSNCALLCHCGLATGEMRNVFSLPPDALAEARAFFYEQKLVAGRPTIFIQPFTSAAHKNWPLENYLAVARFWRERGTQIILGGGPTDRAALEPARQEGFVISAGVPLLVTGGLIQLSELVFGGDTGTLHLAVAQGKRVLMLMRQAALGNASPFQHPEWVIAAPAIDAIAKISLAEVNLAIRQVFNEPAGNVSC